MKRSAENMILALVFGLALVILATVGTLSYQNIRHLITTSHWVTHTHEVIEKMQAALADLTDAKAERRAFIISGEQRYLESYHLALVALDGDMDLLQQLIVGEPGQRARLKDLQPLIAQQVATLNESIEARRRQGLDVAGQKSFMDRGKELTDDIRRRFTEMVREEKKLLSQRSAEVEASAHRTFLVLVLGALAGFGLLLLVFLLLNRQISQRQRAEESLQRARDELEQRVRERTNDLAVANRMLQEKIAERIRAERMLHESNALFESLARVSPVGIFRTDAKGDCTYVNERWSKIAGIPIKEVLGKPWVTSLHPEDRERIRKEWSEASRTSVPVNIEFRYPHAGGGCVWVLGQVVAEWNETTELMGYIGTVTDLTQLREHERALRESEEQFRQLAQETDQVFWFVELNPERVRYVSPSFERIWGFKAEDLYRDSNLWTDSIHPADQPRIIDTWNAWLDGKLPRYDVEYRVCRPGGEIRWIHARGTAVRDAHGHVNRVSGIADDITRPKESEESLLQSRRFLQSTMDALSAHVTILDDHGTILAVNQAWIAFAEENDFRGVDHGVGMNYLRVCDAATGPGSAEATQVAEGIREVINGFRQEFRLEYPCHSTDEQRWFQLRVTRLAYGKPVRLAVAHENVTEIKRAEQSLRQLSGRLLQLQDEERRRIARELHDATGQNLSAATLNLARLQKRLPAADENSHRLISETLSLAEQSLQEIRTVSYLLHPPGLDEAGLLSALRWYVNGFSKRSGIHVDVVALPDVGRLPHEVEIALFRVVQESLSNIHRHSGSSSANIQLTRDSDVIKLEVRDQGKGFLAKRTGQDVAELESLGVGIMGMRERLRQLGGRLEITSGAHGTSVQAIVPRGRAES